VAVVEALRSAVGAVIQRARPTCDIVAATPAGSADSVRASAACPAPARASAPAVGPAAAADKDGGEGDGSGSGSMLRAAFVAILGVITSVALFRVV
jgi:hypothetical protein